MFQLIIPLVLNKSTYFENTQNFSQIMVNRLEIPALLFLLFFFVMIEGKLFHNPI